MTLLAFCYHIPKANETDFGEASRRKNREGVRIKHRGVSPVLLRVQKEAVLGVRGMLKEWKD